MSAVWMRVRSELRVRWRAMLGLALLVGVVGGAAIAAAAGARRTDSSYPRFFAKYGSFQASVSTGGNPQTDKIFDEIAHLPQVVATSRASLFFATLTLSVDVPESPIAMFFPLAVAVAGVVALLTVDRNPRLGLSREAAGWLALLSIGKTPTRYRDIPIRKSVSVSGLTVYDAAPATF